MSPLIAPAARVDSPADIGFPLLLCLCANGALLIGLALFDWPAATVAFMFWAESAIIGLFTLLKVAASVPGHIAHAPGHVTYRRPPRPGSHTSSSTSVPRVNRFLAVPLFVILYGAVLAAFGALLTVPLKIDDPLRVAGEALAGTGTRLFLLFVVLEQGWSSWREFFLGPAWIRNDPTFHFWRPFGLVFVVWIAAFVALFLFGWLDSVLPVLVAVIVLKTIAEVFTVLMDSQAGQWTRDGTD